MECQSPVARIACSRAGCVGVCSGSSQSRACINGGPFDEAPLAGALSVVGAAYEDADRELEERAIAWLARDPEHWPIFRLVALNPWQEEPGRWREGVPRWLRILATDAVLGRFQQDPCGRREPDR
ncbi:MAG: hypothetical protein AVDCRST_MAG19-1117 [uncultured Thermomicrobiales bacterium]|uniref:Uncharacterized protein n=1 Tax=uncultured Thermomicrobiales bacterium TaxID=1645740 RepID=A0A6J4UM68_9BACT|nr:MAG: hypothetical protein AVDCRST_MAG19-1117 [uncultured Thermomicrobiales bacterium]